MDIRVPRLLQSLKIAVFGAAALSLMSFPAQAQENTPETLIPSVAALRTADATAVLQDDGVAYAVVAAPPVAQGIDQHSLSPVHAAEISSQTDESGLATHPAILEARRAVAEAQASVAALRRRVEALERKCGLQVSGRRSLFTLTSQAAAAQAPPPEPETRIDVSEDGHAVSVFIDGREIVRIDDKGMTVDGSVKTLGTPPDGGREAPPQPETERAP